MKEKLITDIEQGMLRFLDNGQMGELHKLLIHSLTNFDVKELSEKSDNIQENKELMNAFFAAKRIEGCSEKTILYYQNKMVLIH